MSDRPGREKFIAGTGIAISESENTTTGQKEVTITGGGGGSVLLEFHNASNVPVDTVATNVAGTSSNFNPAADVSNVYIHMVVGVSNISESDATPSNLTAWIHYDSTDLEAYPGSYAAGGTGQTITAVFGPLSFTAGAHTIQARATSSSGTGNSQVSTKNAKVVVYQG